MPRIFVWLVVVLCGCGGTVMRGQTGGLPATVKRICVERFADKPGADRLRTDLIAELRKSRRVVPVESATDADAVLSGTGETWIRGYYSLNPRVRSITGNAHPIYGGYLSVELKSRGGETLWSYLVTPRRLGPEDIGRNLASQIVRKLLEALR